jgi:4-hydroxythreonine-4-phosphate dehydrogenase
MLRSTIKPIVITPGEPTGIGPDIVIKLLQHKLNYPYLIIADPQLMAERAKQLNLSFNNKNILPVSLTSTRYVLNCLDTATALCLEKKAAALITGPVNKKIINNMGVSFKGHTQYLAEITKTKEVVMFFESPHLRLALVTDHLPLSEVPKNITKKRLSKVIDILISELRNYFGIQSPRIAVCGLNPHAGEGGILGNEEDKIISPIIQHYQKINVKISGPFSADSLFYEKNLKNYDAIIAMYHDQGLSVLKHRDFGKSINITLGLPFLRTSVDHGTAIELAGTGKANSSSLEYVYSKTVELIHANCT